MTSPAGALRLGRSWAERQMTSRCTIFTDLRTVTDSAGHVTFTEVDAHLGIPCRIRPAGGGTTTAGDAADAGGLEIITSAFVVSIPMSHTPLPAERQRLRLTSCPDDPALVGPVFEIRQVPGGATTARRLLCELAD